MANLVVFITAQFEAGRQAGEAWQVAGAPGVTLIEAHGLRRLQETWHNAELLPGMIALSHILRENDVSSLIVLSLVESDALADQLLAITREVAGDLNAPNAGIAFVMPVGKVIGLRFDHS